MNPTGFLLRWAVYLIAGVMLLALGEKIPGWWKKWNGAARYRAWRDE